MAQFAENRISENSSDPVKVTHGDEWQQQPWPRPSAPATISTTATQVSGHDQHHGEDESEHPHKKSVLQKVKDKAKKLIKKKKKPVHGRGDYDRKEEECLHHIEEEEDDDDEEGDTEGEEEGKAGDLNPLDFHSRPLGNASAASPGLDAFSARNLLNDAELARDPEAPSDYRAPAPAETARRQHEVPAAPGQSSAGIAPILQSTETTNRSTARDPDYRSDGYSEKEMAYQVHDVGTTNTAAPDSTLQTEFPPNYSRRKEAPENVLYGQDEPERIEYSDSVGKSPTPPEGIMETVIVEEPAMEQLIQQAAEACGFDSNTGDIATAVGAGAATVKNQNPSPTHGGWEGCGPTESISDEIKSAEELGGTEINRNSNVVDEPQDLRAQETSNEERNENAGQSAASKVATYVVETAVGTGQELKDRIAMGLGSTGTHVNENDKERKDEEGAGHDTSYTEKIYGMTSTAKNAMASKLGYGEHQPVDQAPKLYRTAEEDNYANSEEGKSYRDKIYDTASAAKDVISSKLGYGEHQVPVQEETEKKTYLPSADHDDGANEERGKNFTDKMHDTASAANNVVSSKVGYGRNKDHVVDGKPEGKTMEKYEDDVQDTGEGKSYSEKIYETATAAKNAISSKFGYGGKETAQDPEQQIDEVSKSEYNAHPQSYTNNY